MRIDFGVTSTSSSSLMNSRLYSSVVRDRRRQDDVLVGAGGADVGELLRLQRVDAEVVAAGVDADDHALVDVGVVADEQLAALLQAEQRVGDRLAGRHRHQHAVGAPAEVACDARAVALEGVVDEAGARGQREESERKPISPRVGIR